MNYDVYMPVRVISGRNCLLENSDLLLKFGKKCFIVTGKTSAKKCGCLSQVQQLFENGGIEYCIFDKIEQNPLTTTCKSAGDAAGQFDADFILAIGGGSVLDAAKAIAIFMNNPGFSHSDIYNRTVPCAHIPVILIGTTAGTGSEVTGVSVLTNADTGLKKSISGADCYADIAFCDYVYTKSTNTEIRISTALDAFCHAVEAYLASSANENVFLYARYAVELLSPYILKGNFEDLTDEDFEKIYAASIYAGLAINISGTAFPHTVGYYLTEQHNVPHGKACAVFMPLLLSRGKKYCPERLEAILYYANCQFDELCNAVSRLSEIKISVDKEEIKQTALRWKNGVKNFDRSPGGFSYVDAEQALMSLFPE